MKTQALPTHIPAELSKYFWDVNTATVNPQTSPKYVINRLLDKGDFEAVRWVLSTFSTVIIIQSITTSRDFSVKSATFWARYLNIPKEDFLCMRQPYRAMRSLHWMY